MSPRLLLWRIAAAFLPGGFGVLALISGTADWRSATTFGQHLAGAGVIVYGPLGVAAAVTLLLGKQVGRRLTLAWGIIATIVAALAPVVWGDASPLIGVFSGFSSLIIVAAALWAASQALPTPPPVAIP